MNNLHLSPKAQDDLAEIKKYIEVALDTPIAALNTVSKITKGIRALQIQPGIGATLSSIANVDSDYRFLISGNYPTFYRVNGSDVYVDRILYGRRDYLRILFNNEPEEADAE